MLIRYFTAMRNDPKKMITARVEAFLADPLVTSPIRGRPVCVNYTESDLTKFFADVDVPGIYKFKDGKTSEMFGEYLKDMILNEITPEPDDDILVVTATNHRASKWSWHIIINGLIAKQETHKKVISYLNTKASKIGEEFFVDGHKIAKIFDEVVYGKNRIFRFSNQFKKCDSMTWEECVAPILSHPDNLQAYVILADVTSGRVYSYNRDVGRAVTMSVRKRVDRESEIVHMRSHVDEKQPMWKVLTPACYRDLCIMLSQLTPEFLEHENWLKVAFSIKQLTSDPRAKEEFRKFSAKSDAYDVHQINSIFADPVLDGHITFATLAGAYINMAHDMEMDSESIVKCGRFFKPTYEHLGGISRIAGLTRKVLNLQFMGYYKDDIVHKFIFVRSPTGTGKTVWLKFLVDEGRKKGVKFVSFCSRVVMADGQKHTFGLQHYNDIKEDQVEHVIFDTVTQLDSTPMFLAKDSKGKTVLDRFEEMLDNNPDLQFDVILDEFSSLMEHSTNNMDSELMRNRAECMMAFFRICRRARHVYATDFDLTTHTIECFLSNCGQYKTDAILLDNQYCEPIPDVPVVITSSAEEMYESLCADIEANRLFCISSDSREELMILKDRLCAKYPDFDAKVVYYTRGHCDSSHFADVNGIWQYKYIMFSPKITYGTDYNLFRTHKMYGMATGTLTATAINQQLNRVRHPSEIMVCVTTTVEVPTYATLEDARAAIMKRGSVVQIPVDASLEYQVLSASMQEMRVNMEYNNMLLKTHMKVHIEHLLRLKGYTDITVRDDKAVQFERAENKTEYKMKNLDLMKEDEEGRRVLQNMKRFAEIVGYPQLMADEIVCDDKVFTCGLTLACAINNCNVPDMEKRIKDILYQNYNDTANIRMSKMKRIGFLQHAMGKLGCKDIWSFGVNFGFVPVSAEMKKEFTFMFGCKFNDSWGMRELVSNTIYYLFGFFSKKLEGRYQTSTVAERKKYKLSASGKVYIYVLDTEKMARYGLVNTNFAVSDLIAASSSSGPGSSVVESSSQVAQSEADEQTVSGISVAKKIFADLRRKKNVVEVPDSQPLDEPASESPPATAEVETGSIQSFLSTDAFGATVDNVTGESSVKPEKRTVTRTIKVKKIKRI